MPSAAGALPNATLAEAVAGFAETQPNAAALVAPGRPPLAYAGLNQQIHYTLAAFGQLGLRGARVGVLLPNGPELAAATVAVSAAAICVPLNPSLRSAELRRYLEATRCEAVLLPARDASDARQVADALGLRVIEAAVNSASPAGTFRIVGLERATCGSEFRCPDPSRVALVMQTSGTTGESAAPRLVPLTHKNVYRSALHTRAALQLTPSDRCLNVMPVFLIHGIVGATFSSLSAGASVVCIDRFDPVQFLKWLDVFNPTWYTAVPTMHQAILEQLEHRDGQLLLPALRFVRSSSSPLSVECLERLEAALGVPVIESYGMTEAASQIASNPLPPLVRKPGSVGLPNGPDVAIFDAQAKQVVTGVPGEIVVRGPNVMCGYEADPAATAEAFVDGWLRTGDEGYFDADGYLYITGRLKEQINRGGEKILPAEIDDVLRQHPAVRDAACFGRPHPRLGEVVAAAVIRKPDAVLNREEVREFVASRLSDAKVPLDVYFVDELPRSPLGKLQRRVLARQLLPQRTESLARRTELTPTAEVVRRVWGEILHMAAEAIEPDDDFFLLGGDSVLGLQVTAALANAFSVDLSAKELFQAPTLSAFAARVDGAPPSAPAPLRDQALEVPLSYAQQRFWFTSQVDPDGCVNNIARVFRLRGPLDLDALERAVNAVVEHQPALRTIFPMGEDGPMQVVHVTPRLAIEVISARESDIERLTREEARRPFNLEGELPIRVRLLRIAGDDHVLLLTLHHIATDGWSTAIVERELSSAYAGAALSPLGFKYTDYTLSQRAEFETGAYATQLEYWTARLRGAPVSLPLPTWSRRPTGLSFRGALCPFELSSDLVDGITALARREQATPYMALLAAFAVLLGRHTGETEVVIGTPVAGRSRIETHALVGCFINSLPLRIDLSGNPTFRELLKRVRAVVLEALAYQDLPFDRLVEALGPTRDARHASVFQAMFALQNLPPGGLQLPGIETTEIPVDPGTARLDLTAILRPARDGGLRGTLEFNTDLLEPEAVARMSGHYQHLLRAVVHGGPDTTLGSVRMLDDEEWAEAVLDLNARAQKLDYPRDRSVVELFREQVQRVPTATAVRVGNQQLSYAELEQRSNQLARALLARGDGAKYVGVSLPRSVDFVVAILAVLKCGAAYVPVDPAYPAERRAFMLRDTAAPLVIDETYMLELAVRGQSTEPPCVEVAPTAPAYVLYTSGSTGKPKGVVVPHRAIVRLVCSTDYLQLGPDDRVAFASDLSFDAATFEIWGALLNGAELVGIDKDTLLAPATLRKILIENRITAMFVTTSVFNLCAREQPDAFGAVESLLFGGEVADPAAVRTVLHSSAPPRRLLNVYGPTESTTFATWYPIDCAGPDLDSIPIGRPIANTSAYVLDANRQAVPRGATGELYLGGDGLAIEYLNDPTLTAERFVPDPFCSESGRIYRTGDLVRLNAHGELQFVGRVDDQVKIRGVRVEPAEVQAVLEQHPAVYQSAVIAREDSSGTKTLVAGVVLVRGANITATELRRDLSQQLLDAWVPTAIAIMQRLPLTAAGKIDRVALVGLAEEVGGCTDVDPPRTPREQTLERIWARVLQKQRVGIRDSFFDLGGHSLLAARLFAEVERTFSVRLPLSSLFPEATIERQAKLLEESLVDCTSTVVPIQPVGTRSPFICVHAIDGDVLRFEPLARLLQPDQPFYGLRAAGLEPESEPVRDVESMARGYIRELERAGFREPFYLGGFSAGATIAFEMACQLTAQGKRVAMLALIDGSAPVADSLGNLREDVAEYARAAARSPEWFVRRQLRGLRSQTVFGRSRSLPVDPDLLEAVVGLSERHLDVAVANAIALQQYTPRVYPGRVLLFRARVRRLFSRHDRYLGWARLAAGGVELVPVGGEHAELLREPSVRELAAALRQAMDRSASI